MVKGKLMVKKSVLCVALLGALASCSTDDSVNEDHVLSVTPKQCQNFLDEQDITVSLREKIVNTCESKINELGNSEIINNQVAFYDYVTNNCRFGMTGREAQTFWSCYIKYE